MKVGFPFLEKKNSGEIVMDETFHTCTSFGIYDVEQDAVELVSAEQINSSESGGLVGFFKENEVYKLISPGCHTMAAKFFQDNKLQIYKALNNDLLDNVMMLQNRMLAMYGREDVLGSSCGSDCSSCSTSTCSSN